MVTRHFDTILANRPKPIEQPGLDVRQHAVGNDVVFSGGRPDSGTGHQTFALAGMRSDFPFRERHLKRGDRAIQLVVVHFEIAYIVTKNARRSVTKSAYDTSHRSWWPPGVIAAAAPADHAARRLGLAAGGSAFARKPRSFSSMSRGLRPS